MNNIFSFSLPSGSRDGFHPAYFDTSKIGTSDCNEYIPAFALYSHELHVFENEDKTNKLEILEYHFPYQVGPHFRQYSTLVSSLVSSYGPKKFIFKVAGVTHVVNVFRGVLYDEQNNILMCLGIKANYVMSVTSDIIGATHNTDEFMLFISDKFSDVKYKNLRKKLELNYISHIRDANIDIIETKKIDKWLYSNNYKAPSFKSVLDMKKHLKEEVPKLMLEI